MQAEIGTLFDGRSGETQTITRPGCSYPTLGGPSLMLICGNQFQLYSVATGGWRTIPRSPIGSCVIGCAGPVALGKEWIELDDNCDEVHFCPTFYFQNVTTGEVRPQPRTDNTSLVDLNAPALTRRICPPLHIKRGASVAFEGRFVIVAAGRLSALERCGSHMHVALGPVINMPGANEQPSVAGIGTSLNANAHEIIWRSATTGLSGLFLPSLRRLQISIPAAVGNPDWLSLDDQTMYIANATDQLWSATLPSAPPRRNAARH